MPPFSISKRRFSVSLTAAVLLMGGVADVAGQEAADSFPISCPDPAIGPVLPPTPDRSGAPLIVYARQLDAAKHRQGEATGNVELFRADQHMSTERMLFDPVEETVTIPGDLSYEDRQVWFRGSDARYSFSSESGRFSAVDYGLTGSSANGSAELVELVGGNTSILHRLEYTTCSGEQPDWLLHARELELKHDEGFGTARGAWLEFKGVPILYAPYFSFPIDDRRKSGFLYPSISQNSDSGMEVSVPWYWNIAPNQDATLEPRYFSNRGFMLTAEYRLLTRRSSGKLQLDYLHNDKKTNEQRYFYHLRHQTRPWARWRTELDVERISDDRYFQDFGTNISQTSRQFLRGSASLHGVGRYWRLEMMVDDFQVIDDSVTPENEPYRRLPRIDFQLDRPLGATGLSAGVNSEFVYFDRSNGPTGARLDLYPNLVWQRRASWGYLRPSVGMRYTAYELDRRGLPGDESPRRDTAIASLDAGLFFERRSPGGGLQTIEPRLFYLYVPFEEQDDLPLFDSGEFTFGFSQLFNTNRFAGGDRQGDANQLALAVTTTHFDGDNGQALWSLGLGQIFYFDPLRVRLDDQSEGSVAAVNEDLSPFLAEFNWNLSSRYSAIAGMQWNWEEDDLDLASLGVNYRGEHGRRIRFEYRFRRNRVDQFDFHAAWPLNERWRLLSRVNYSFADDDLLEIQAGVEYESCCWAIRTVLRRFLRNRDGDFSDGIYFELNLKGLSRIGTRGRNPFGY
ncbi:MAG: LPS assembly protein LptD [Xanthomonadales bacterium]|nr:LPS assembly protein LptD [Xanthomonadales bacterium]